MIIGHNPLLVKKSCRMNAKEYAIQAAGYIYKIGFTITLMGKIT
jgi:hypothetical protein